MQPLGEALAKLSQERIVELASNLIQIPSITGEEKEVMERAAEMLEKAGAQVETHGPPERPIVSATWNPEAEKLLVFNGHLDVVPISNPDAWDRDPWTPHLEGGKLYGRGASDMKTSCAAMIHLLETLKDSELDLAVGVHLVPDEEKGGTQGTKVLVDKIAQGELRRPDYMVIGEQSNLQVRVAERGLMWFQVRFHGRASHTASCRVTGINAIAKASKGVLALEHHLEKFHPWIGHPMQSVNMIQGGAVPNQVPALCTITVDRRLIIDETAETVLKEVREDLDRAGEGDPDWRYEIVTERDEQGNVVYTPANYTPPDSELGQAFMWAVREALGEEPQLYVTWAGSTDGRLYREIGIQTIGFGPMGFGAHGANEFVYVDSVLKAARVWMAVAHRLAG